MLTEISVIMCYYITSEVFLDRIQDRCLYISICAPWLYGIISMLPPMFGWSRFIPGAAGISCCPDWLSTDTETLAYNIVLMMLGFFIPITVIAISYAKIYRWTFYGVFFSQIAQASGESFFCSSVVASLANRQTDKQTDRQTETDKQTDKQTDKLKQTNRQTQTNSMGIWFRLHGYF